MKAASELKASKKARTALPRRIVPAAPYKSWLERLPAELIEQIFLHALEVNMAKASPFLGRTLAKESIYRTLILFAFFDDDESYPAEKKHFAPAMYRVLSLQERLRLQRGVLESRWCTLARIKQNLSTLRRLVIVQEWYCDWAAIEKMGRVRAEHPQQQNVIEPPRSPTRLQSASSLPARDDKTEPQFHCSELDDIEYNCALSAEAYANNCMMTLHNTRSPLSILYFPNRLIDPGSWYDTIIPSPDNTKNHSSNPFPVDFLRLIIQGYRSIIKGPSQPIVDGATLVRGIETAIRQHHRQALELLLEIYKLAYHLCSPHYPDGVEDGAPNHFNPPKCITGLLHLATKQCKESPWILDRLASVCLWAVTADDEVLIKWALKRVEEEEGGDGDWFASLVLRDDSFDTRRRDIAIF